MKDLEELVLRCIINYGPGRFRFELGDCRAFVITTTTNMSYCSNTIHITEDPKGNVNMWIGPYSWTSWKEFIIGKQPERLDVYDFISILLFDGALKKYEPGEY